MYTALRLQKRLKPQLKLAAEGHGGVCVTVLDPDPYMTYQPFLPEAAAGSISPRHVVVPLRRVLTGCQILIGEARSFDHERRVAHVATLATAEEEGEDATFELPYSELVLAPGSVARTLPVPGLAEHGIGFKTVEEAISLRNHVLEQLDIASSTRDPDVRDAALTFVFVGGGYAGVEALAELEDMARYACRYYHNVQAEDLRFLLVEASDRILPEVGAEMGRYALRELRARNIDVRMETRLDSCERRVAVLSDGSRHPARTLVWTAGVRPHPVLAASGLPLTERGRLRCAATLRVAGVDHAWSAGDAAAVPDLTADTDDAVCAPNAQHALRQSRRLADNLADSLEGADPAELTPYRHAYAGSVASLGLHKGVAHVYGRKVKGYPAWLMHRVYHLSRVPTFNRKARVLAEWMLSGLFKREIVSLGSLEHPRAEFESAAGGRRGTRPS
ncbi:FAD-dependent oxidoreductase [Streptomyces boncukensis]|uniref:FAD-dependent oxidoreductase n=1 Tax=Streptomyces boncukensis TaxID=2711219 RepID=A0A6G4X8P9_9ACTN|nr:FAD-dependent oxidoreductase [Streptomyces boncukensis]